MGKERDEVIKVMKEVGADGVWMKPDTPIAVRAVNGFLLGLKYLLVHSWDFEKWEVKADLEFNSISVGGD